MLRMRFAAIGFVLGAICVAAFWSVGFWGASSGSMAQETKSGDIVTSLARFAGSATCSPCHVAEHTEWAGSHHAAAMQEAKDETVLGRFDGATFAKDDVESTFFKRDGKFWVHTEGPNGKFADFQVRYTFGVSPLQQYLIELPGGRLQALGIAWDSRPTIEGGQRWYHLYPDSKFAPRDPLHWAGGEQNWNYQCAWCHSTNLKKHYDRTTRTFKTEWSEINVGCEACHGPASGHLAWASKSASVQRQPEDQGKGFDLRLNDRRSVSWPADRTGQATRSQPLTSGKELLVCAGCHARREQFSDASADVRKLYDAFRVSRLEPPLYYADGQQRDEVFNHASFLQSKMHAAGVTCSDCHNPHSGKLRQSGNAVCAQCHVPERFDAPSHHRHAAGSTGAQCASCHMPITVYMGVDPRHDHSMRIPRPDRTLTLGTPNACSQCHVEKSIQWAADAIKAWYPSPKPGAQSFAEAFDLGDRGAPGAQSALIKVLEDPSFAGIVRASAIARLSRYPSRQVIGAIARALEVNDPDIRSAAVAALSRTEPAARQALLVPLLKDEARLVRMDSARELAGDAERGLSPEHQQLFEKALAEYVAAQLFNAERSESHVNLGELYLKRGMTEEARAAFAEAIAIEPTFVPAAISLADLERASGNERAGEAILMKSLETNTRSGPLLHALGLNLVRQKRHAEALEKLAEAANMAPEDPRFTYVLAVAKHSSGNARDAIDILKTALVRHPFDREILITLISYEIEARDFRAALARAELFARLEPERADILQLITRLKRESR